MEWWQIALILIASIIIGVAVGVLLRYLILRFVPKHDITLPSASPLRLIKKPRTSSVPEGLLKLTAPDLLAEVKHNQKIATEPLGEKLLPFQTSAWDVHQYELNKLPSNLRDNLEQAYADMRLANSIVWVSTEFGRRTNNLDEKYVKLCNSIAERLDKITPLKKQMAK